MARKKSINIDFPLAGLNRRASYRQQAPFTTASCLNVRAIATLEGRERGGSRPGLTESHIDNLGAAIRMLSPMTLALGDGFSSWSDNFSGTSLAAAWTQASWASDVPLILPYAVASVDTTVAEGEVVLDALPIDTSENYTVEMFLVPWEGAWHGDYRLYLRLDDTTPDIDTEGTVIELVQTGNSGAYTASLTSYTGSSATVTDTDSGAIGVRPGWLSATVVGDVVTVYWNGTQILSGTVDTQTGVIVGFGMECTVDGGLCLCNTFRVQYYSTGEVPALRSMLVASADGDIYNETSYGRMTVVTTDLTVRDDTALQAAQSGQDLYIADYGDLRITQTDGVVSGDQLTATVNPTWNALGILTNDDVVVISSVSGSIVAGTYKISSAAVAGALTLASSPGDGPSCTFRIERAPKVYDPSAGTVVIMTATTGQVPTGCPLVARYLDRIVLAGAEIAPHVWYMARQSDELDWDYSQEDSQRAVAGTASAAGVPGEPITAIVPHSDDYLIIACRNSLWRLLGDPAFDGSLNAVSHTIGVIGPTAWCRGPAGEFVFLSLDGLYAMPPGGNSFPIQLSREILPREFLNLNPDMLTVSMEYDIVGNGIHIFLTPVSSNDRIHWWFDWSRKTFWPVSLTSIHEPTATCAIQATVIEDSGVILGGRDGTLRRLNDLAESDCGTSYETYAKIGPIQLAVAGRVGTFLSIDAAIAEGSGDVTWNIASALTMEGAASASASDSGTWSAGLNATIRPACRGQAFTLKLTGTSKRKWACESMSAVLKDAGPRRIL